MRFLEKAWKDDHGHHYHYDTVTIRQRLDPAWWVTWIDEFLVIRRFEISSFFLGFHGLPNLIEGDDEEGLVLPRIEPLGSPIEKKLKADALYINVSFRWTILPARTESC